MIYSLMRLQLGKLLRSSARYVTPVYVPVPVLIVHHLVAELLQGFADNYISALRRAQVQKRLLFLWTFLVLPLILMKSLHGYRVNTISIASDIRSRSSARRGKRFILLTNKHWLSCTAATTGGGR